MACPADAAISFFGICLPPADLLTIMGMAAALAAFAVSLCQYRRAQQWKRREFVAKEMEKIFQSPKAANALMMLDYTLRRIELLPQASEYPLRFVRVSEDWVAAALIPHVVAGRPSYGGEGAAIRDCFDDLLTRLDNIQDMIEAKLVLSEDVDKYLSYWTGKIAGVGEHASAGVVPSRPKDLVRNLWLYIWRYGYTGVQTLCKNLGNPIETDKSKLAGYETELARECACGKWEIIVSEARAEARASAVKWSQTWRGATSKGQAASTDLP
jgi:hypothetical protein